MGASQVSFFPFASSRLDLTPSSGRPEQRCLRPYQERVVRDFLTFADEAWVHSAERFGRIVLPPRTGKTAIAACIARQLRLPATFLVPTKTLVEQTASEVESWLGEPVGVLYSDALDLGLLAPLRVWVLEVDADSSGVRVVAGDYDDATLGSLADGLAARATPSRPGLHRRRRDEAASGLILASRDVARLRALAQSRGGRASTSSSKKT